MKLVVILVSVPLFTYGLLNVVAPRMTLGWQVRSTVRHNEHDPRAVVGKAVQRWLGISPEASPDRAALRRIRVIGVIEMALAVAIIAAVVIATS